MSFLLSGRRADAIPDSDLTQYTLDKQDTDVLSISSPSSYEVEDIGANDRDKIFRVYDNTFDSFKIGFDLNVTSGTDNNEHYHIGIGTEGDSTFDTLSDWVGLHIHDGTSSDFDGQEFASRVGGSKAWDDVEEIFASYSLGVVSSIEMEFDMDTGTATLEVTDTGGTEGSSTVSFDESKDWDTVYALMASERDFSSPGSMDAEIVEWDFDGI